MKAVYNPEGSAQPCTTNLVMSAWRRNLNKTYMSRARVNNHRVARFRLLKSVYSNLQRVHTRVVEDPCIGQAERRSGCLTRNIVIGSRVIYSGLQWSGKSVGSQLESRSFHWIRKAGTFCYSTLQNASWERQAFRCALTGWSRMARMAESLVTR